MEKISIMIWRDIAINYSPDSKELSSVLSEIFLINEDETNIAADIEKVNPKMPLRCVSSSLSGKYSTLLCFYLDFVVDNEIEKLLKFVRNLIVKL
jgi:hypothetical protein